MLYPNRLINLKQTVKHLRLKHCLTRAAIAIVSTIIQCVFTWDAITPPSGEPDTARLPIYQGEAFKPALPSQLFADLRKHSKVCAALYNRSSMQAVSKFIPLPIRLGHA